MSKEVQNKRKEHNVEKIFKIEQWMKTFQIL